MGKKAKLDDLYEMSINTINIPFVNEYISTIKESVQIQKTKDSYITVIEGIFKFRGNWEISFKDYTEETFENYILELINSNASESRINFISGTFIRMKDYFIKRYPNEFDEKFLSNIFMLDSNTTKNIPARSLTPAELSIIKMFIDEENQEKLQYIFNVFYYIGAKKKDFAIYNPRNADFKNRYYVYNAKKYEFIDNNEELLKKVKGQKIRYTVIAHYFPRITHKLRSLGFYENDKTFTYDDIMKTRENFFFTCPCCGRKVENMSTNWVLVKYDKSNEEILVCSFCKGVRNE